MRTNNAGNPGLTGGSAPLYIAGRCGRLVLTMTFLVGCLQAVAQTPPERIVIHRNVLWMTANTVLRVNNKWGILADASHRRSDLARENDLTLLRFAPVYWITPDLSVAAGYAHLWSAASGTSGQIKLNENRLYQQMIYVLRIGRGSFNNRLRIEQRWREASISGVPSNTFNYTTRYRYLLGYRYPLSRSSLAPQLVLAEEIMLHTGEAVKHGLFEQNRLFAGIQWRFSSSLNLETGYMYTWQKQLVKDTYQSIHTLRLTLSYEGRIGRQTHTGSEALGTQN